MNEEQSSYRSIMKATSIFGGVQVISIVISIIRSKLTAVLLGATGMGITGLLTTTIGIISGLTSCGLGMSAVRDVAAANASGNQNRVVLISAVLRRWIWVTGLTGVLVVVFLAPYLSKLAFGNDKYVWSFVVVSVTLLSNQVAAGQLVLLQGLQKFNYLAKASLAGSVVGLLITIPLYYFFKNDGIVPALVSISVASVIISWYYGHKTGVKLNQPSLKETISEGKQMLKMGFLISFSTLLFALTTYVLQIFISNTGGIEQVGLFTAGFAIINTYIGLIFNAMSTDYYPRLSAVAESNIECKKIMNQQAEISVLILAPIIATFLVFVKLIIVILYSDKFAGIMDMLMWLSLATFLKAGSWAIAFILLAKAKSKIYFWNELIANIYVLMLDMAGYYFFGLVGLGISCFVAYFIYFLQVFILSKVKFDFSFDKSFYKIFVIQFSLAILCFIVVKYFNNFYSYLIGIILIAISCVYSFRELDKRLDFKSFISKFLKK